MLLLGVCKGKQNREREALFREIIAFYCIFDTFALGKQLQDHLPSRK
jgi:hypothetical protein